MGRSIAFIKSFILHNEMASGAFGTIALKLLSVLLGLLLAIILARTLGPSAYGVYAYVFALTSLIAIPAQLGLPALLVRETARAQVGAEWSLMKGLWHWATFFVGIASIFLVVLVTLLGLIYSNQFSSIELTTFAFGVAMIPFIALANLRSAALRGLRHVVMGQFPEMVVRPGVLVLLLLMVGFFSFPINLTSAHAMGLHMMAAVVSFIVAAFMLRRVRPLGLVEASKPIYASGVWLAAAWPLALISGMQLINQNTDIIMLGFFRSVDEVGVYKVAVTGASLVALGLQAITMAISPHFARLHVQGDMERLQRLVTLSTRAILLFSLPVVFILVFFGDVVLLRVFGKEYVSGQLPLAILAVGQLVNAAMGSVGMLLIMSGHERETARAVGIAAIVNVILNFTFIPPFGVIGAAVATAITVMIWNLLMWRAVHQRLGIESMAFRIFPLKAIK